MAFATYETVLGTFRIDYEDDVAISLTKLKEAPSEFGIKTKFTDIVFAQLDEYFNGIRNRFEFKYELRGTQFQKKVWQVLCTIPYGETRTYKEIAKAIGNKNASQAVGLANSKNPLMIIVPCHRVIGSKGDLVGYAGGLSLKETLLKIEEISNI
ncbi:cysteine methyltransferase [Candidatus Epulonipiscium fishelsonii]|uniref:Cysteine methyltransferase n=1 Tax=Candidatus Epulonipiscium fishelsonii TaxID=77094 RepID=A0ACC8X9G3_9FIRM|nr:cysteine methyltransferase [Epulopiscium sp. SCG-B11WGA-EpuloA1]